MVRRTLKGMGGNSSGRRLVVLLVAAVAGACSAPQPPPQSRGLPLPLTTESQAPGGAVASRKPVPSEALAPLLAGAELVAIQQAVFEERFADAAREYAVVVAQLGERKQAAPEHYYLLGRLQHLGGDDSLAEESLRKSTLAPWLLEDYARVLSAKVSLRLGHAEAALTQLRAVSDATPIAKKARLLQGEALLALNEPHEAVLVLGKLLGSADGESLAAELLMAKALTATLKPGGQVTLERSEQLVVVRALHHARAVSLSSPSSRLGRDASALETRLLAKLPPPLFEEHQAFTVAEQLVRLQALVDSANYADALAASSDALALTKSEPFGAHGCEARYLRAKALAGKGRWGEAADLLAAVTNRCTDRELHAKSLFLAGKYSQADKRYAAAVRYFERLELECADSSLADDGRLRRAQCYRELGDESRFTQLLTSMPADYPEGDMVLDGVFDLAMQFIERGDWATVSNVLLRVQPAAQRADRVRDHEYAGRERYFLARSWIETGEAERGYKEYEALIKERPLSYYMQLADARLQTALPERAAVAKADALRDAQLQPFEFAEDAPFERAEFKRGLELLRVGEYGLAQQELSLASTQGPLLWAAVLQYAQAGATSLAHKTVRAQLTDWLGRWPVGQWAEPWKVAFPRPYHPFVQKAVKKHSLPEALIYAIMREESGFDARVVSHADAYGLMQLIMPTAKHFAKREGLPASASALKRPKINIALGAAALRSFMDRFPNNPLLAVPGYNAGPGRPKRWLKERPDVDFDVWVELIPFRETRRYTKRVLASRGVYAFLYPASGGDSPLPQKLHGEP